MAVILKLPESTIKLIAAGEIISKPVNIVKELLENSLDAGATNVRITIEQGGLKLIEIIDNGKGIANSNAEMLCRRYATSKLSTADDLRQISTFGFRGEALASVSEMADIEVKSLCMESDKIGWVAKYKKGELVEPPCDKYLQNAGTQIRVTNLFASAPSRRAALQSSFIEEKKTITDLIIRYAIHHRDTVTMSLKDGNNDLVCLLAPMKLGPCIGMFYGIEMENNLMEVSVKSDTYLKLDANITISYKRLSGNSNSGSNSFNFILFVNDRLVESNDLKKELEALIHEYLSMKMYNLLVIVSLVVPTYDVDVNTHPSKATVALHYHVEIVRLMVERLRAELRERLNVSNVVPSTPIIERTVSQLLSQSSHKPNAKNTETTHCAGDKNHLDHNQNSKNLNYQRLGALAPASLTPQAKRSYDLVHNDASQRTLDQLARGSSRRKFQDDIRPWPGIEYIDSPLMGRKKVIFKSPSPDTDTVLYRVEDGVEPKIVAPLRARRNINLRSLTELKKLVASEKGSESIEIIKNSTFVGLFDHSRALIQHETRLYAINLKAYLKEQYYQFYLFDFGNFPPIEILPPGNKIRFIIDTTLDDMSKYDTKYYDSLKFKTTNDIVEELLKHASMFEDYFSLKITRNEILTIPCIMPDEVPNLTYLGRFLVQLANVPDFSCEKLCFREIGRLMGDFYAEPPANLRNKAVHRNYHNLIQTKLYDSIKKYLLIPDWLLTKENICQISDTKDLYKVFERC